MTEIAALRPYMATLDRIVGHCRDNPPTLMTGRGRIAALAMLYLRYERIQTDRNLAEHPFAVVERMARETLATILGWEEIRFAEAEDCGPSGVRPPAMEDMHQDLFQKLWTQYDIEAYKADRIARYERRIDINDLAPLIRDRRVIDFGCGHGNFAHALVNRGAAQVVGIDFGDGSLAQAEHMRKVLGVAPERMIFRKATVYDTGEPDAGFDFAIQNGVFHHLDDEDRAYAEVYRVLKPGGWFWVYTDGENAISHHLWDAARMALANLPTDLVIDQLRQMNLAVGKRYHVGDGLNAVYRHTNWAALTDRLGRLGFGDFQRKVGGFPTDFDHDVIAADRWGAEKFGSGDLRLICRKLG